MITLKYFTQTLLIIFSITISSCDTETEDSTPEVIDTITPSLRTQTIFISQTIEGDIESRAVIIQTPAVIDFNKKYPLVFAFHGRGGSNTSWVNKLSSFTNSGEFVGIYPQGFLESWNLGTEPSKADDVAFVNLIIEELEKFNNLDFDRMYAIGTSNGSGMVNKLGIETTHFKAIAPIVSQLMESSPLLPTTQPISVYQINGAADTTIPIEGGPKLGHVFLDASKSAALWANHFDCNQNPEIQTLGEDTLSIYTACNNGKEIRYLRVENGAHNLHWGNPSLLDDVWTFFQRF